MVTKEDLVGLERIANAVVDDFVVGKGRIDTQKDYADGIIAGIGGRDSNTDVVREWRTRVNEVAWMVYESWKK